MGNHQRSQGCVWPLPPPVVGYESVIPNPKLKLLDQVREVMRLKRYSLRTETTYREWIRRYILFHRTSKGWSGRSKMRSGWRRSKRQGPHGDASVESARVLDTGGQITAFVPPGASFATGLEAAE